MIIDFPLKISDVFDNNGNFVKDEYDNEIGKELLIQKMIGYISYVKGEDPFKFPYRIWLPSMSDNSKSIFVLKKNNLFKYPKFQLNDQVIKKPIKYLDLIITNLSGQQQKGYNYIISKLKEKNPILSQKNTGIQYTITDGPLQTLNIIYPHENLDKEKHLNLDFDKELYGKKGLGRVMGYDPYKKNNFYYKKNILNKYGRFFSLSKLKNYSSKLFTIMNTIIKSKGIILIYSQFIDGGCVPVALALEELGFKRYGEKNNNLFKEQPGDLLDSSTMKPSNKNDFNPASYVMITGDKKLSPNNKEDLKVLAQMLIILMVKL